MAYQLSDLTSEIQRRANDTSFSSTEITDFINDTQREVTNRHQWPFMEKVVDGPLTVEESIYDNQADHDVTLDSYLIDPTDPSVTYPLDYIPHDEFFMRFPNPEGQDANMPRYWTNFADKIHFNVPADLTYTFRQRYLKSPTSLSATTDVPSIPERYKEVIIRGALARLEERRDNFDFAAIHRNEFENLVEDMAIRLIPRQYGTPSQLRTARTRQYGTL